MLVGVMCVVNMVFTVDGASNVGDCSGGGGSSGACEADVCGEHGVHG